MSSDGLEWMDEAFRRHADLCKTLSDPKRLMILQALKHGERSVGELAEVAGMSLANTSQHLALLRHAGLVSGRREARVVYYSLAEPRIIRAADVIHEIVLDRLSSTAARPERVLAAPP